MRWLKRYRLRSYLRGSAWPVPTAAIPVALAVSPLIRAIDQRTQWRLLDYSSAEAVGLLGAITPAALTMVVLILSMLLLAVQLAASQYSPRLIGGQLARRPVKICLFILVFSYVYCAGVLGRTSGRVPQLSILVAIVSTLVSVAAGLFLIDYLAKELRPVRMLARVAEVGRVVIEQVYPRFAPASGLDPGLQAGNPPPLQDPVEVIARTGRSGVLLAIDLEGLAEQARRAGCAIEVVPQVGDFVARGDPLFRVQPRLNGGVRARSLSASLAFGNERTYEQDPAFVFRVLVDVACKALSPAINDPTTAVLAIDQIHHLLRQVGIRFLDTGELHDPDGTLRLLYRTPDWEDFVLLAVTEIRHYGSSSIQVARRLRAMLENLIRMVPPPRAAVLREQLRLLQRSVVRSFAEAEDQECAGRGDYQGVGSSRDDDDDDADANASPVKPPTQHAPSPSYWTKVQ
ncbi:MAG TPA: DUF2254 domain-containing protein [Tepidisphaeraceae bacterium]